MPRKEAYLASIAITLTELALIDQYHDKIAKVDRIIGEANDLLTEIGKQAKLEGYTKNELEDLVNDIVNLTEYNTNYVKQAKEPKPLSIKTRDPFSKLSEEDRNQRIEELENKDSYLSSRIDELESELKFYRQHRDAEHTTTG